MKIRVPRPQLQQPDKSGCNRDMRHFGNAAGFERIAMIAANFIEPAAGPNASGASLICYPLNNVLRPETAERWRSRRSLLRLRQRKKETIPSMLISFLNWYNQKPFIGLIRTG